IAEAMAEILDGGRFTDQDSATRQLTLDDILVVTPYNAQVRCLQERLPGGARVGTVDKFQGQEAPVVFFSMATSSDAEIPRNVEFLFSRNRLNVAISRAQCLAVLVASPELLHLRCRHLDPRRATAGPLAWGLRTASLTRPGVRRAPSASGWACTRARRPNARETTSARR